jgi:hypothetical protein
MKNVVYVFSKDSNKYPRLTTSFLSLKERIVFYVFYVITWILVSMFLKNTISTTIKTIGFLSGFFLIYIFDFLNNQNYGINISQDGKYFVTKTSDDYQVLKENSEKINLKKNEFILLKKDVFDKLVKDENLQVESLYNFYNPNKNNYLRGNLWKYFSSPIDSGDDYNQLDLATYNYLAILLTISGVVRSIDRSKFKKLFPWIVLAGLFSLCSQILFKWNISYDQVINEFIIKQKLFIFGISFGISVILSLFYFDNI